MVGQQSLINAHWLRHCIAYNEWLHWVSVLMVKLNAHWLCHCIAYNECIQQLCIRAFTVICEAEIAPCNYRHLYNMVHYACIFISQFLSSNSYWHTSNGTTSHTYHTEPAIQIKYELDHMYALLVQASSTHTQTPPFSHPHTRQYMYSKWLYNNLICTHQFKWYELAKDFK